MSHNATVLEDSDVVYIGMMKESGEYVEVRLANVADSLLVTLPGESRIL